MPPTSNNRSFWPWISTFALVTLVGLCVFIWDGLRGGSFRPLVLGFMIATVGVVGWWLGRWLRQIQMAVDRAQLMEENLRAEIAYCQEERDQARQKVHELESNIQHAHRTRDDALRKKQELESALLGKEGERVSQREQFFRLQEKNRQIENELSQREAMFERVKREMEHQILERAQTEERLLESQTRLQLINQLSIELTSGSPMDEVTKRTLREMATVFPETAVFFSRIAEERYLTIAGVQRGGRFESHPFRLDLVQAPAYRQQLKLGGALVAEDVAVEDSLSPMQSFLQTVGLSSLLATPITAENRIVGVLAIGASDPRIWRDHEIETLTEITQYLALAMKSAQVEESRRRAALELLQAKEAAEMATRSKSDFLATMSHEIRTPLNGVLGMTKLLMETRMTPDQAEFAHIIHTSGELLLSLINDILDFSKIEAGKLRLEQTAFKPRVLLENAAELLAVKAQEKGLEMVVLIPPDLPQGLIGDPGRLTQIFINLIGNAIKFTEHGEVCLSGALVHREESRAVLKLSVTDTGVGIPADRIECLFESFTQVDASTTRKFGGTGLGLAITKRLVEMMDGTIKVTSEEGVGSAFDIQIPFEVNEAGLGPALLDTKDLSVLVLDERESSRLALEQSLLALGCEVHSFASAEAVSAYLSEWAPSSQPILVFDLDSLNDKTPLTNWRQEPHNLAVIGIQKLAKFRGDDAGLGDVVITKPVKQAALRQALEAVLNGERLTSVQHDPLTISPYLPAERHGKILLVDDHAVNRKLCAHLLRKAGYEFEIALDGEEAVEVVAKNNFSLVLMDCRMPKMDGFEATRLIRQSESKDVHLPIIALTASAMDEDRRACLAAGMDDFLSKPIDEYKLFQMLDRYAEGVAEKPHRPAKVEASPDEPVEIWRLRDATDGDPQLMAEMVDLFLDQAARGMTHLQTALTENNNESLRNGAHALKGACANIGAGAMRDAASLLEELGAGDSLRGAPQQLQQLMQEYEAVHHYLKQILNEGEKRPIS